MLVVVFLFCLLGIVFSDCPPGTFVGQDSKTCYAFNIQPTPFWMADVACKTNYENGNLASIGSAIENSFLISKFRKWCGEKDEHLPKSAHVITSTFLYKNLAYIQSFLSTTSTLIWLGGYKNGSSWTWLDGSAFSYANWAKGTPKKGQKIDVFRPT